MNPKTPFETWAAEALGPDVTVTPCDDVDFRAILDCAECDVVAAQVLSIAHEVATLLRNGQVRDEDQEAAHSEIYSCVKWALRMLGIAGKHPELRAEIRAQYLGGVY